MKPSSAIALVCSRLGAGTPLATSARAACATGSDLLAQPASNAEPITATAAAIGRPMVPPAGPTFGSTAGAGAGADGGGAVAGSAPQHAPQARTAPANIDRPVAPG